MIREICIAAWCTLHSLLVHSPRSMLDRLGHLLHASKRNQGYSKNPALILPPSMHSSQTPWFDLSNLVEKMPIYRKQCGVFDHGDQQYDKSGFGSD